MADIAVIFHWSPPVMDQFGLAELMCWRERARARARCGDGDGET
ncbi:hypothetical protein JOE11_003701 [Robbsia andropogonis]